MLVVITRNYQELSLEAAKMVSRAMQKKPDLTLGLPTGNTPVGMYQELIRLHRTQGLDFSRVTTFNLDEYLGLDATDPRSYHHYMDSNFFQHINIPAVNIHIPDGTIRSHFEEYCAGYEDAIRKAGGIDLLICGIGRTGHIGFNEPSSSFGSRTRVKTLTHETIQENQSFFQPGETVPECVITMGIGTILEARKIVLLASGKTKAAAVGKAIEGSLTASVSASALQLHTDVTTILDEDASTNLTQLDYYRRVMEMTAKLTPDRL